MGHHPVQFSSLLWLCVAAVQANPLDFDDKMFWLDNSRNEGAGHQDDQFSLLQLQALKRPKQAGKDRDDVDEQHHLSKDAQKDLQIRRDLQKLDSAEAATKAEDYVHRASIGTATLDAERLAWMHIPKAGTSFANTLMTWGCTGLGEQEVVDSSYDRGGGMFVPKFISVHRKQCRKVGHLCGGHLPIGPNKCNDWTAHQGNFVGLFRQPEQRVLSGFNHNLHDIPNKSLDLVSYADAVAGCSVRMMNGHKCGDQVPVTPKMMSTAMERLKTGFAFVGLTDQWELSVCLFHAMFGGDCHEREFENVRPGANQTGSLYETEKLGSWTDMYDGPLYAAAETIFRVNAEKFGVNHTSCQRSICSSMPKERLGSLFQAS